MPPAARTASIALRRSLRAFQRCQFLFHQRRRGPLAARLDAREQIALQTVFVGGEALEVGVVGIGLGHQIEQIEGAAGSGRQVGGDGGDNASRRTGDEEYGVRFQRQAGLAIGCGLLLQAMVQRSPFLYPISTAPGSRRVSAIRASAISAGLRLRLRNQRP